MKLGIRHNSQDPSDEEIERDVVELRRLLDGVEGPKEPHPAYYQNFLVHVRERIDEGQVRRRRRFSPSLAWGSLSAAAMAVILFVSGVIDPTKPAPPRVVDVKPTTTAAPVSPTYALADNSTNNINSIVLSESDVQMLNAIESNNDDAILQAMIDSEI